MLLGVNVDHVATVREARKVLEPDPAIATDLAVRGGADGITVHLREDRRHICDSDLKKIRRRLTMMKDVSFWSNRLHEMHFGQLVIGKIQFLINMTILLKVFDAPVWMYYIGLMVSAFLIWYIGRFLEKKGFRKYFREAEFKDVRIK